ncbi:TauD/TfdA family dioxygenase [Mangrovimicrobium sediminis]|uniref:TauD/TfdA family dioxygenase n=1 Tax=Mangrovimicrobium sediminis TaxID=2562682 RepID=A0A4Z0M870_9GAMM|nr:TauD/TfdA family dioxygenase [Haliea sp. SAOS-164]TGD75719.1 TauD/TfdA family dioxygenase [Haliea sp. SAOS-164]
MELNTEHIKPLIGSRIHASRADFANPEFAAACRELLDERIVLLFPGIGLDDDEQLAFTDLFGERVNFVKQAPGGEAAARDVYKITLDPKINNAPEYVLGTFFWHMDGVMETFPPPLASLLTARSVAPRGGQTEFCNLYAAYEHLPDADKAELEGLRVHHSVFASIRGVLELDVTPADWQGISKSNDHPLVWTHEDGRKSLLVGTTAERVLDMPLAEGRALLVRLLEWAAQPDFSYRHEWAEGDFVVWKNSGALHRVIPYDRNSGRTMHRTSVLGTEAIR